MKFSWPFFVTPFPNGTGAFLRIPLSREKQIIASGVSMVLCITRPCNPGSSDPFLLLPFALRPDFPISLVGRYSYDSYGSSVTICLATGR